jgi:hypothetical protein
MRIIKRRMVRHKYACIDQENIDTLAELARDFCYCAKSDGYEAYYALRELFEPQTDKRKIIGWI